MAGKDVVVQRVSDQGAQELFRTRVDLGAKVEVSTEQVEFDLGAEHATRAPDGSTVVGHQTVETTVVTITTPSPEEEAKAVAAAAPKPKKKSAAKKKTAAKKK